MPMISKVKKISYFLRLTLLLVAFSSFSFQAVAKPPKNPEEGPYQKLIRLYSECIRLEEAIFSKLSFELSPDQFVKTGSNLKLTLLDNFGRPWIFKPTPPESSKEYRAIAGYRIYKLFGLNSPETHAITLTLNGKTEKGSIQRYVEHLPGHSGFTEYKLAPGVVDYLLKAQTLDWLLKNYDTNFENFIILSQEKGVVDGLCRVDLEALLSEERGAYNYGSMIYEPEKPWFKKEDILYHWLLQEYNSGKIDIDWKSNLPFVEFVADLPDDFFKLQVLPGKTSNFSSSGKISAQNENFLDPIIKMKKNLRSDFGRFYDGLGGDSGGGWYSSGSKEDEIRKACDNLSRRIEELKIEEGSCRDLVARPVKIEARVCVEGYKIVYQFRSDRAYKEKGWEAEFDRAWRRLSRLESEASGEREKEAIRYYKQQMRKIRLFRYAELVPTEIDAFLILENK